MTDAPTAASRATVMTEITNGRVRTPDSLADTP